MLHHVDTLISMQENTALYPEKILCNRTTVKYKGYTKVLVHE